MNDSLTVNNSDATKVVCEERTLVTATLDMLRRVELSQAAELARGGHFGEAESLISGSVGDKQLTPAELDLMARIRAQQGRLTDAEEYWTKASAIDPENSAYTDGLRRIAAMRTKRLSVGRWGFGIILILLLLILLGGAKYYIDGVESRLHSEMKAIGFRNQVVSAQNNSNNAPELAFKLSGITTQTEGANLVVTFNSGLFRNGVTLRKEAMPLLTAMAKKLEPHVGKMQAKVIGHTDSLPVPKGKRYLDNNSLALARAVAVVETLRASAPLPASMFQVIGLGEGDAPYPNDGPRNRLRNRTVVMRFTHIGD